MTATAQSTTTRTATSWLRGLARGVFTGPTLQAAKLTPVAVFAVLVTVGAAAAASMTGTPLTHLWQLPAVVATVLVWGWASRAYAAVRREEAVHPVAKALALPVLVLSVAVFVLVFVVTFGDPSQLGGGS